jgi:hypothetical protein
VALAMTGSLKVARRIAPSHGINRRIEFMAPALAQRPVLVLPPTLIVDT